MYMFGNKKGNVCYHSQDNLLEHMPQLPWGKDDSWNLNGSEGLKASVTKQKAWEV